MPLTDDAYNAVISGAMIDKDITEDMISSFLDGAQIKLYVMSIAIDRKVRQLGQGLYSEPLEILLGALWKKLEHLAKTRSIRVTDLVAVGWTSNGCKLARDIIGMTKVTEDKFGFSVFQLELTEKDITKSRKRPYKPLLHLISLYKELNL
jgi:hypothetical protein